MPRSYSFPENQGENAPYINVLYAVLKSELKAQYDFLMITFSVSNAF